MKQLDRRSFLATTSTVGLAFWPGTAAAATANDDLRVAVIGLRSRGRAHLQGLGNRVVALCDVDEKILAQTRDEIATSSGKKLPTYVDYRHMLDKADIDAVSIATPNHTHALLAIAAVQAGKHVYVEKPVSHNVWEGQQIVAAARHHKRIVQCGTQARSGPGLTQAVEWVQSGELGEIQYAVGTCYKPRKSIGKLTSPAQIPSHINYDLWCGPAEMKEIYRPNLHYDWHWDFNTGNGDLGNQGVHQVDIARWFLGEKQLPDRVLSIGGRFGYEDAGNTPNTQVAYFDYAKAPLIFETRGLPRSKESQANWGESMNTYRGIDIGVLVQCQRGHVIVPNYSDAVAFDLEGKEVKRWSGAGDHFANWLSAIERQDAATLNADIQEGHVSSAICHIASISHLLGKQSPAGEIAGQIAANDLLSNSYDRMCDHLRANDVTLEEDSSKLCLGRWLKLDPEGKEVLNDPEATAMLRRQNRPTHEIPEFV